MSQQVFGDRYELVRHIARGGMAQVYLAKDLLLDRPVALKVLFPELSVDGSFVERFRREAKAAANLTHPNIVSIYDWGQGKQTYFFVMEYVDGRTLSSVLRDGPLDPARAAQVAADIAAALEFAHRRGVIHRDVKPGNVLLDESGQVKVADFGIARAIGTSEDLTQTGSVMGTATYFSPEQAQGYAVDPRSDVYSLGVVLYEMVVGHPPFTGDSPVSIAYKHVKELPVAPSELNPAVPASVETIIMKALQKDPAARYQRAGDLRSDLVRFLQGQPVSATAADLPTRLVPGIGAAGVAAAAAGFAGEATSVQAPANATMAIPPATDGAYRDGSGLPPGRSRKAAVAWLSAVLVVALAAAGFFGGRSLGLWGATKNLVIPPSIVHQPVSAAKATLRNLGFTDVREQEQYSATVGVGEVITTRPVPGTSLPSDKPVVLVVSRGQAPVPVPNVVNLGQGAAEKKLHDAGFKVNTTLANSSTVKAGNVISTNPPPGQPAAKGSVVQLMVSTGKKQVQIPTLVNDDPGTAGSVLGALQLTVVQSPEPSSTVPKGLVTRTDPPAGTSVPVGSTVTLYVSSGMQVKVPSLQGDTEAEATSALAAVNLTPSFTIQTVTDPTQDGLVLSQSPGAGTSVPAGTPVTAVVGSYNGTTTTTTTPPSSSTTATPPATGNGGGGGGGG